MQRRLKGIVVAQEFKHRRQVLFGDLEKKGTEGWSKRWLIEILNFSDLATVYRHIISTKNR